jgi:hypothetical protein
MTMPREFYIPKGARAVDNGGTDASVYAYEQAGKFLAIAFHGKAAKPDWHYSFRDEAARDKRIAEFIAGRKRWVEYKAERKAEKDKPHTLKVGDILVSSWGYDQTNIDYYQVTRIPGPMTVEIREIAKTSSAEIGFMTAECKAAPDKFTGDPMIKRCNSTNSVRIASYASASKWDGKADRYSWYA